MRRSITSRGTATTLFVMLGLVAPPVLEAAFDLDLSSSASASEASQPTRVSASPGNATRRDHRVPAKRSNGATQSDRAPTVQPQAQSTECAMTFRENAIVRDHRSSTSPACRAALAEHNRGVLNKQLAKAPKGTRDRVESQLQSWEIQKLQAEVEVAKQAYENGKAALRSAPNHAKAQAQAKLSQLERDLHAKIEQADKHADKVAADLRKKIEQTATHARTQAADYKRQFERASGKKKHELEAKYLQAERTLKKAETLLADHDLAQAQRKLDAAKDRVGKEAQAMKQRAQAELDRAKKRAGDVKKQAEASIAKLEGELDRLKKSAGKIKDEVDGLKDTASDLLKSFGI